MSGSIKEYFLGPDAVPCPDDSHLGTSIFDDVEEYYEELTPKQEFLKEKGVAFCLQMIELMEEHHIDDIGFRIPKLITPSDDLPYTSILCDIEDFRASVITAKFSYQRQWLEYCGPEYCLSWVNKMEDEMLEEVWLNTPQVIGLDGLSIEALADVDHAYMIYTIEDFLEFTPKGEIIAPESAMKKNPNWHVPFSSHN